MGDDIGMKLFKFLMKEEPDLLNNDMAANARACRALANNLGSLLATIKVKKGQAYYEQAARLIFAEIDDAARSVHAQAHHFAQHEPETKQ